MDPFLENRNQKHFI